MKLEDELKTKRFKSQAHKASINILFTSYWLKTKMSFFLKPYGITVEQYNVMRILKGKHPDTMCVKDIGSRTIEKNSNVPRILDRLVRKGIAFRQQSLIDKRETNCQLTDEGIVLLDKINEQIEHLENKVLNIDEATATKLNEILDNIRIS